MYIQPLNFGYNHTVRSYYYDSRHDYNEHLHHFTEIVLVLDGELEITVDEHCEIAKKGEIAVITSLRRHGYKTPSFCKTLCIIFSNDIIYDIFPGKELYANASRVVFTPSRTLWDYVVSHAPMQTVYPFAAESDPPLYRVFKSVIYPIVSEYLQRVPQVYTEKDKSALLALLLYIENHFKEDLTLASVSAALGYTEKYMSHCLPSLPGINFRYLLNSLRVDHAKILLGTTEFKIIDIALESGFSNERTMQRAFQAIIGMTPAEYRARKKVRK